MSLSKGSLWHKWDFHVHTPASHIEVSFGSDWDFYVQKLVESAYNENVSAIGITDYFSVEGYKRIKTEYFEKDDKLKELFKDRPELLQKAQELYIFPNIELRLNTFIGQSSINYHVLFSDKISIGDIEDYFLGEIDFVYEAHPQDESYKMKLKRPNLEVLGRRIKRDQPNIHGSDLTVGLRSAVVSLESVNSVLRSNQARFGDKYLLGLPCDEDLSQVSWAGRDGDTRRQIIAGADFLLASNLKTRAWAVGEKAESRAQFVQEFKGLKPCIWGSDAHAYDKLFKPDGDRNCWVKADLSFEGLKQIKYEPNFRARISATKPDEKIDYYVIDRIRFRNGTNNTFSTDWIEINPNLTTIIGGKSSGKSLLLYYLAKTINPKESEKLKGPQGNVPYECENDQTFDFEVHWADKAVNTLRQDVSARQKKITYLPQLYINSLVEGKGQKELNRLIEDVLMENEDYKKEREKFSSGGRAVDSAIEQAITSLFSLLDQKQKASDDLAKLGDKQAHVKQIEALKDKITQLTKESSLTENERKTFEDLRASHKKLSDTLKIDKSDYQNLQTLNAVLSESGATDMVDSYFDAFYHDILSSEETTDYFKENFEQVKERVSQAISAAFLGSSSELDIKIAEKDKKAKDAEAELNKIKLQAQPFAGKFKNKEELTKQEAQLKTQSLTFAQIESHEKKIVELSAEIETVKAKIWEHRSKYRETYQSFADFIKTSEIDKIAGDVSLLVDLKFDKDDFHASVISYLNLNTLKKLFPDDYDETHQRLNGITLEKLKIILENVLSNEIRVKANVKKEDLLRRLLRNYLSLGFNLKHKGDDLFKMSPGKRGIVVLKLLLHLSNSQDPILIDQPEDNLDNRTIYEELNSFIQEKKSTRQIIMVTHNANLVVATDAEEVIVCNQGGQQEGRDNKVFTFEYVMGPLESSFTDETQLGVLYKTGIKEHVCDVLEGGKEAFINRQAKYNLG